MSDPTSFVNAEADTVQFKGDDVAAEIAAADDKTTFMTVENVARVGWAAHREWERIIGEQPKPEWDLLPQKRRDDIMDGVAWILNHSAASILQQHDAWRAVRASEGFAFGDRKDAPHLLPNMVHFDDMPYSQRLKAWMWRHLTHAFFG